MGYHSRMGRESDLSCDELRVLAGMLRIMMMADSRVTSEELHAVARIGTRLGLTEEAWDAIWEEAAETLPSADAVLEAASTLSRVGAREAVYEQLYRLADADHISEEEWDLLEWIDEVWLAADK